MSNQLSGIFPRKLLSLFVSILFTLIFTACTDESIYPDVSEDDAHYEAIMALTEAGLKLVKLLEEQEEVMVELDVEYEERELTSHNVIAKKKPEPENDPGKIVIIGAHHDSVPDSPGANDNASGVSAVLELARVYADYPVDTEVRFVTFGTEEWGLFGSAYYVENLPEAEHERIVSYYEPFSVYLLHQKLR